MKSEDKFSAIKMTVGGHLGFWAHAELALIFERDIRAKSFSNSPTYKDQ